MPILPGTGGSGGRSWYTYNRSPSPQTVPQVTASAQELMAALDDIERQRAAVRESNRQQSAQEFSPDGTALTSTAHPQYDAVPVSEGEEEMATEKKPRKTTDPIYECTKYLDSVFQEFQQQVAEYVLRHASPEEKEKWSLFF